MAWKDVILLVLKSVNLSKPSSGALRRTELPLWSQHANNITTKIIIKSHASTFQCKGLGRKFSNIQLINSVLCTLVLFCFSSPSVKHQRVATARTGYWIILTTALLFRKLYLCHCQGPPHSYMEITFSLPVTYW